jgi:hypothetical protein
MIRAMPIKVAAVTIFNRRVSGHAEISGLNCLAFCLLFFLALHSVPDQISETLSRHRVIARRRRWSRSCSTRLHTEQTRIACVALPRHVRLRAGVDARARGPGECSADSRDSGRRARVASRRRTPRRWRPRVRSDDSRRRRPTSDNALAVPNRCWQNRAEHACGDERRRGGETCEES